MNRDIFINALLPYLNANTKETDGERLNRWALKFVEWYEKNEGKLIKDIEDGEFIMKHLAEEEVDEDNCLEIFAIQADQMIPCDVMRSLRKTWDEYYRLYRSRQIIVAQKKYEEN